MFVNKLFSFPISAGAMRIPHNHFLTKYYVDKFHLKTIPFQYYNEEGYIYVQGEKVKQKGNSFLDEIVHFEWL